MTKMYTLKRCFWYVNMAASIKPEIKCLPILPFFLAFSVLAFSVPAILQTSLELCINLTFGYQYADLVS